MITVGQGFGFQLNANGTQMICGYETVRHVDLVSGAETPWPLNGAGAWYPGGWDENDPVVFSPVSVNPMSTRALVWRLGNPPTNAIGREAECVGHAGLEVINGKCLSTNSQQLISNGREITPEPFSGVVWDGTHYGYKRGWDGSGPFVVRRVSDNAPVREIPYGGMYERPYTLSSGLWVAGNYGGRGRITTPTTNLEVPELELCGLVFEHSGVAYVVTAVMGSGWNPRGVMVRPWSSLRPADPAHEPSLRGWFIPDLRHQFLQARVRPSGEFVIAGGEFPGSGIITIEVIDPSRPMGLVPPEHAAEPVPQPPPAPPQPPVPPQPRVPPQAPVRSDPPRNPPVPPVPPARTEPEPPPAPPGQPGQPSPWNFRARILRALRKKLEDR